MVHCAKSDVAKWSQKLNEKKFSFDPRANASGFRPRVHSKINLEGDKNILYRYDVPCWNE